MKLLNGVTLPDIIAEALQHYSLNIAVEYGEKKYRYRDIEKLGEYYQRYFQLCGLKKGDHIGLLSDVTPFAIGAMLGALYAGIIYIPINIHAPATWVKHLVMTAELKQVLAQPRYLSALSQSSQAVPITLLEAPALAEQDEPPPLQKVANLSDNVAYILYTSGSTGNPKGIMLTHRNACSFIVWMQKEFAIHARDRIFSRAPLQFDLSVFDIFTTLLSGACLVIVPEGFDNSPFNVVNFMREKTVTVVYTVPSAYIRWFIKGKLARGMPSLRTLLYAGEPFSPVWLRRVMDCLPAAAVANIYGPTETNIVTCQHVTQPSTNATSIPIGVPVTDTEIHIVDEALRALPQGEMGEILVRGSTVFAGYFNAPSLTAEKLIQSPFHAYPTLAFRTGDYGYYNERGEIIYRGRIDNMVKTRGYRVEIGEVENAFAAIEAVEEVAIITLSHDKYGATLHACLSLAGGDAALPDVQVSLAELLPDYMYPFDFTVLDVLPKTATGKIDRLRLKAMCGLKRQEQV